MKTKQMCHTPGPWFAGTVTDASTGQDYQQVCGDKHEICRIPLPRVVKEWLKVSNDEIDRKTADSKLIATAPDLLDVIKQVKNMLNYYHRTIQRGDTFSLTGQELKLYRLDIESMLAEINAAIAKVG